MSKPRPWYFNYSMNYIYSIKQSLLFLDWQEELELRGKLLLRIKSIWKVYSSDSAIRMDGDSESFDVIASIGSAGEIW